MTAEEFADFIHNVRAEIAEALARLDTVDPADLEPALRVQYLRIRAGWETLRKMTADDVLELHAAACERAGRELTPDEIRALLDQLPRQ